MNPTALVPTQEDGRLKFLMTPVIVAYTGSPLAITRCTDEPSMMTITHLPSGRRLSVSHYDQGELTRLLERLVELPWPRSESAIYSNKWLCEQCTAIIKSWKEAHQGGAA